MRRAGSARWAAVAWLCASVALAEAPEEASAPGDAESQARAQAEAAQAEDATRAQQDANAQAVVEMAKRRDEKKPPDAAADPAAADPAAADPSLPEATSKALAERAAHLKDLLRGRLPAEVDGDALLRWSLVDGGVPAGLWAQARLSRKERTLPDDPGAAAFVEALGQYLALPESRQRRILAAQRKKHQAHLAQVAEQQKLAEDRARLVENNARIERFLAGELALDDAVDDLLEADLVPPELPTGKDLAERRLREELEGAYARRRELVDRYAAMSPAERRELRAGYEARRKARDDAARQKRAHEAREQHDAAQQKKEAIEAAKNDAERRAEEVAEERRQALQAAARAASEAQRLYASERARLLGVQESLAHEEAKLADGGHTLDEPRERALSFQRRVWDLAQRSVLDGPREKEADALYHELRGALTAYREKLAEALSDWRDQRTRLGEVPEGADTSLLDAGDRGRLEKMRAELDARRQTLREQELELMQQRARALQESVNRMNRSRLELLRQTSAGLRLPLLGFGPEGVAQMQREVNQLMLAASYHLMMLPRDLERLWGSVKGSSLHIVFGLLKLLVVVMVFRAWRQSGDRVLGKVERRARAETVQTSLTRWLASMAWYARRVRHPIEWLLLLGVLHQVVGRVEELPELGFLWLAAIWVTIGWAAVLMIDALAVRRHLLHRYGYESPELRMRTLRLVALMVVTAGLVLAWTDQGVGRGTVYAWVKTVCLLGSIPVLLLLLYWWRDPVHDRLKDAPEGGSLVRWALAQEHGWRRFPATLIGAGYLMSQGLWRLSMRQAARFEWMQRIMAYLFRTQVERQAQAQVALSSKRPLELREAPSLRPEAPSPGWIDEVGEDELASLAAMVKQGATLTVVVGERGSGRSAMLQRVAESLGEEAVMTVSCAIGSVRAFERDLTEAARARVGKPDAATSIEALRDSPVRLVCVDDVQRMVRPAVGGLVAFERLVDLAQKHDSKIAWVFAITASAWAVVSRAREASMGFDLVVELPPWTEKQIARLLELRNEAEGIDPSFDELTVPRQLDVAEDMDPLTRTKLAYYRILWDFSDGNPMVALHFWHRSLFRDDKRDRVVVGLFDPPQSRAIEDMPAAMHFMLRAVLQLDRASPAAVAECTGLPVDEVYDALQLALRRGYVERAGRHLRLTLTWYRTVSTVLRRQHLLVS